ncbi:ABC transporter permease [Candidatus Aerophobetes bacterium]|nr:ABC transporter permease [Candidatus Aerophobetes bacterium]
MLRFLLNRLVAMIVTMFIISILIFVVAEVIPVDPAKLAAGRWATKEAVAAIRKEFGLDRPAYVRYINWISGIFHGDFGTSIHYHRPVSDLIAIRLKRSLILASIAFCFMIPLGLALGFLAGVTEGRLLDRILSLASSVMVSSPAFIGGVYLIVVFSILLGWLPGTSTPQPGSSPFEVLRRLILPILTLSFDEVGYLTRFSRSTMVEVMQSDYIRTAVLKGLTKRKVILRHALRNALIAPFTAVMLHVNWMIGGVVIVEILFNYPGLGYLVFDAAMRNDIILLEGATLVLTFVAVVTQVIGDIGCFLLDPRIRFSR